MFYCSLVKNTLCTMRTLPIPIDSDSTVKEPHEWHVPYEHKFFRIITIKNE